MDCINAWASEVGIDMLSGKLDELKQICALAQMAGAWVENRLSGEAALRQVSRPRARRAAARTCARHAHQRSHARHGRARAQAPSPSRRRKADSFTRTCVLSAQPPCFLSLSCHTRSVASRSLVGTSGLGFDPERRTRRRCCRPAVADPRHGVSASAAREDCLCAREAQVRTAPEASHGPQRRRQRTIIVSTHYALVVVVYTR